MNWEQYIQLWEHALIQPMDIRQVVITSAGRQQFLLPSSGFIYVVQGQATIWLDGDKHVTKRFYLLHAGKGSHIVVEVGQEQCTYFYILYKGSMPTKARKSIQKTYLMNNPFQLQYYCEPLAPVILYQHVESMHQGWHRGASLERFQVKIRLYQFVHELVRQFQLQGVTPKKTDLIEQIIQYIHEHYYEPITLESLAELWSYSIQYLSKQFKQRTGRSPIEYVIQTRMAKAKEIMMCSDVSIQEIAASVGYSDVFYFTRLFKKQVGITPSQYKSKVKLLGNSDSPWKVFISSMGNSGSSSYIDNDNRYQYRGEGENSMLRSTGSKIGLTLMLCFTLMLTACSNGGSNQTNSQGVAEGKANQGTEATQNGANHNTEDKGMRKISTVMGEVTIPTHPERVVVDWHLGQVLAVGVTPVGASKTLMDYAAFLKPFVPDSVQEIGRDGSISMEKVLDLSPDIIITWNKDDYENYSKIAPTVVFDTTEYSSIQEEITAMGDILGRQEEAKNWLADFDKRTEVARNKVKSVIPEDATLSIVDYVTVDKYLMVVGNTGERGGKAAYDILGLKPTPKVKSEIIDKKIDRLEVSWETVGDYVGDYLIVLTIEGKEPPQLPATWTQLDAVKNGRVIEVEMASYFAADSYSTLIQSEDIADKFTKLAETTK
ncbi:ABC transporter substrate-binding protein [Paenibacillus segetis]|uniref:Iron complex transport system substrate-binding protein n=1 Tax=Paenibacillus segetis TaxID=1325360 RepID=A0ABQ1YST6_9BACL|nr:AraC family transcriptional regulator [Paenibacillus segetis]GGH36334.1 hypothetical protein GCM10008013_43150 [Paenibacillus segetis]